MAKPTKAEVKRVIGALKRSKKKFVSLEALSRLVGLYPDVLGDTLSYFEPMIRMDPSINTRDLLPVLQEYVAEPIKPVDPNKPKRTVISKKETTIMQLDSAAMAQYGIRLQAAEKAWLVRTAELEKQLHNMQKTKTDSLLKIDSIPIPYPVEVVKTEHHWGGWIAFIVTIVAIGVIAIKRLKN